MPSVTTPPHCQKFSWVRRKCIPDRLIDGKAKVKEKLRDQFESMKSFVNKFLFGLCLENQFSKSVKTEQNLKSLFTCL